MKTCIGCKRAKPKAEFSNNKTKKDGLRNNCKACDKQYRQENAEKFAEYQKRYRQENAEYQKRYRQENAEYQKRYRQENAEYQKRYRQENAEKIAEYAKQYNKQYIRERLLVDPLFKFSMNVRSLVRSSFKRSKTKNFKKQTKTETLLGCTIAQLHEHLVKQFMPGMSLDNHGEWHIDHIIPLATAQTQQDIERLCHYTNLQPLWAEDNLKKGDKL